MTRKLRTIPCAVCWRQKWRETDPENQPGHYSRKTLRGWCNCVEDERGFTIKAGTPSKKYLPF